MGVGNVTLTFAFEPRNPHIMVPTGPHNIEFLKIQDLMISVASNLYILLYVYEGRKNKVAINIFIL